MKLKVAPVFGEHAVLQRGKPIPVWGTSVTDDLITVRLHEQTKTVIASKGEWEVLFDPEEANEAVVLEISSERTGEKIRFEKIAVGEVWLCGGQSNMEFLMRYDRRLNEALETEDDPLLRCYTAPQTAYLGFAEIDHTPDTGFWRSWKDAKDREMFTAVGAYMGRVLREALKVPVGLISCNWGGSPAAAWTSMEDLKQTKELEPVLQEYEDILAHTDWRKYIPASEVKAPEPTPEQKDFEYRFMMGEDMTEFFKNFDPTKLPPQDFAPFMLGPRSVVRPAGLYENMLKKIAPYALRGFLWYQGEDDDARDRQDYYDVSMKTMIGSWRKLWNETLPFYQIELAPFRGIGMTGAKRYAFMRHQQEKAMRETEDVHDICILDAGEEFNIHPRNKRTVGERLARSVLKHTYHLKGSDCPRALSFEKGTEQIRIRFTDAEGGMELKGDPTAVLHLYVNGEEKDYEVSIEGDTVVLQASFAKEDHVKVTYCEDNWCVPVLFDSIGDPAFAFTYEG